MREPGRSLASVGLGRAVALLACCVVSIACAGSTVGISPATSPTAGANGSEPPAPSAVLPGGRDLAAVPTACVGLGEQDCRRVVGHIATLLTPDDPEIGYVQVGPFGCSASGGCPTTLAARPEGDVGLESPAGALSYHVSWTDGNLDARRQEAFVVELSPSSRPLVPGAPQPYTLGHCGLFSGIDHGGSWWDPVGLVDYDHPDAINAAEGTIAAIGPDRAIFTSNAGLTVQLVRRDGPKSLPLCD